ncbi:MAG: SGNH/GDSL hydrolase family protein [Burkholderiales bacterium]|jgi:outer membrane lipase/esterase|nr:SGNH/GDSL hydrolase family protein [Burkholderiales bacterium]
MRLFRTRLLACAAASLMLVGCWNEEEDSAAEEKVSITSVKVFGDSLADVGTFGLKFTVQSTSSASPSLIYPERVAQAYGITSMCPVYLYNGTTFTANTTAGCTNHAIGGGRINNASDSTGLSPVSIRVQLANAAAAGSYSANDLLVIDGGGNDAADLVGAYLNASNDSGIAFLALVRTLLGNTAVDAVLTAQGPQAGMATLGGMYMQALANAFHDSIKANALDKGAQHLVLINLPGITKTPRFQFVLANIEATLGATTRAQLEALFGQWFTAFNAALSTKVSGDSRVMLLDLYTNLNDQVVNPASYGLQNTTTPACPATGTDSSTGLPTYDWTACTDAALSASVPEGATGGANWWKSYLFSDSFHPTPYGHELFYNSIRSALVASKRL